MRLSEVRIRNYRSCRNITVHLEHLHAIIGANNSGKSSILRALDFFFNPSTKQIDEETFWNKDTTLIISIVALFVDLTEHESKELGPYLQPDGSFLVAREAVMEKAEGASAEERIHITQKYNKLVPKVEWLNESRINGKAITEWWKEKDKLFAKGESFQDFLGGGSKPTVDEWKTKAGEFSVKYLDPDDYEETWIDNPRGYAGVLKAALPFFVLVPAIRDVSEESKVGKTNPFGKLVYAVMDAVTSEKKQELKELLGNVARQLNRSEGGERLESINKMEARLNESIQKIFSECDLEIEFQTPTFEILMTSPRIYADDGLRTLIDNKGHGLQRAVIFSILRSYADLVTAVNPKNRRTLIFTVEEPELYMHPLAQRTIRKVFREIADGGDQVYFSTHSALLVDVAYFDEIIRTEGCISEKEGRKTVTCRIWQLPVQELVNDEVARHPHLSDKVSIQSIRDHYSNAYNPKRNEGFYAKRILLVEGPTEDFSLPVYAEAIGKPLDAIGVALVECGGKSSMDRHIRMFNELGIPCYVLIDYDKSSRDKDIVLKSKELLKMMDAPLEPPERFTSYEKIACFEEDWETEMKAEYSDYDDLKCQARGCLGSDSKPLIARYIARKMTEESPPRIPTFICEIIDRIEKISWTNSCLVKADCEK